MATSQHTRARRSAPAVTRGVPTLTRPSLRFHKMPFEKSTPNGKCFWSCPPSTGYVNDVRIGRQYGADFLKSASGSPDQASLLLTWVVLDMVKVAEETRGFIVGFFQVVGVSLDRGMRRVPHSQFDREVASMNADDQRTAHRTTEL